MARRLAKTDVVIIGAGWTGLTAAYELAHAGKRCVVLERGSYRHDADDFAAPKEHDELKYAVHHAHMINTRKETLTFRNNASQQALPMRRLVVYNKLNLSDAAASAHLDAATLGVVDGFARATIGAAP